MEKVMRTLMKEGKDINEILDMPYHFVLSILEEKKDNIRIIEDKEETEAILDRM